MALRLHRDVDLLDLAWASTVMQMQVVSTGKVLYSSDPVTKAFFEMRVYSAYALLNEERRRIWRMSSAGVMFMVDDVLANKVAAIKHSLRRVREESRTVSGLWMIGVCSNSSNSMALRRAAGISRYEFWR